MVSRVLSCDSINATTPARVCHQLQLGAEAAAFPSADARLLSMSVRPHRHGQHGIRVVGAPCSPSTSNMLLLRCPPVSYTHLTLPTICSV